MQEIIHVDHPHLADNRFQDGALPHLTGVQSFQILRCNRLHPEWADDIGWTYNHAAMLAWYNGLFLCEYLSNPVSEHEVPGHTMLTVSRDGIHWDKPQVAFPEVEVPTAQYKGPRSPELKEKMLTVPHQRMGFFHASNGVMLMLSFYGIVHDRHKSAPCDGWGVGRAVRRIYPDGSMGENIYFLIYNEPAGYTAENTLVFAPFRQSGDAELIAACEELLRNGACMRQMYEEQRFDKALFPTPAGEALSYYTVSEDEIIGMYKKGLVSVSRDGGATWSLPERQGSVCTATGKVWGQKTSDGRYTLMYNPTTDGQHRWPIAAVTGEDGHRFDGMAAVTGDMSPQRYGGLDKNLGPQYMRGIAECNPQTPDGHVWLAYSNNKEDIWVSRIPVPLTSAGDAEGSLTCRAGHLPEGFGIYAPVWAPVEAGENALTLRDKDPYDRAVVERNIRRGKAGRVHLTLTVERLAREGSLTFEMQDDQGRTPIRLVFMPDGVLRVRGDGRTDPWQPYQAGQAIDIDVAYDCDSRRFTVKALGAEKSFGFSAAVDDITRFRLMTKERIPHLSTLDDVGKWGTKEQILPGGEEPTEETVACVTAMTWKVEETEEHA